MSNEFQTEEPTVSRVPTVEMSPELLEALLEAAREGRAEELSK